MTKGPHLETMSRLALIDYVYVLEGQIEALRAAASTMDTNFLQSAFKMTLTEANIVVLLSKGEPKSKAAILNALYWNKPDTDWPELKIVDVFICKIRRKLTGSGISVLTLWGTGYQMSGLDKLADVMAGKAPLTDQESIQPNSGRTYGVRIPGGYGPVRLQALNFFKRQPQFTISEFSAAMLPHYGGTTLIRQMEKRGVIRVIVGGRLNAAAKGRWKVEVLV